VHRQVLQGEGGGGVKHDSSLRRHGSVAPDGHGIAISALHPAYRSGRTIFPSRVFDPDEVKRLLKSGHQNRKIGRDVRKGPRRGWPIYMLTLEERATCPRTCQAWAYCYGNQSQAAERINATDDLMAHLWQELADLEAEHPAGFLVRLHILGDFFSELYVDFWRQALDNFPALHVFGFTARDPHADPIGEAVHDLAMANWDRFAIRFSGQPGPLWASRIADDDPEAVTCPAQLGRTDCCATCALCWQSQRSIAFRRH
jgi:hypothetical protein